MKKRAYMIAVRFILLAACSFCFASNGKSRPDVLTQLCAVGARVETIGSEAFMALYFLSTPGNVGFSIKSEKMTASTEIEEPKVRPCLKMIAEQYALTGEPDPSETRKWYYNFNNQVFNIIDTSIYAF